MATSYIPPADYPVHALRIAAEAEGAGLPLNEHYNFEEYISRRGAYIRKCPTYAHLENACFVARRHAAEVFPDEKTELHVQDVREREIETGQNPLLPLPTTTNTETIDGWARCLPHEEMERGEVSELVGGRAAGREADVAVPTREVDGPVAGATAASGEYCSVQLEEVAGDFDDAASQEIAAATELSSPTAKASNVKATQASFTASSSPLTLIGVDESVRTPPQMLLRATASVTNTSAPAPTAPMTVNATVAAVPYPHCSWYLDAGRDEVAQTAPRPTAEPLIEQVSGAAASPSFAASSKTLKAATSVFAMVAYGMSIPVKFQKRSQDVDDKSTLTIEADDTPPSRKKTETATGITEEHSKGVARKFKKPTAKARTKAATTSSTTKPRAKAQPTTPRTSKVSLTDIVNGTALPGTKGDAVKASAERRALLLNLRQCSQATNYASSSSGRALKRNFKNPLITSTNAVVDLMPEFHDPVGEDSNEVHCLCGVITDDGAHMVQCEKCYVWQHSRCLLPGKKSRDVDKMKEIMCQVCDPWERSEVVMKLRRE